jgi:hypothetical protein
VASRRDWSAFAGGMKFLIDMNLSPCGFLSWAHTVSGQSTGRPSAIRGRRIPKSWIGLRSTTASS